MRNFAILHMKDGWEQRDYFNVNPGKLKMMQNGACSGIFYSKLVNQKVFHFFDDLEISG